MAANDYYMVRIEGNQIQWIDPVTREQRQIGLILKAAKELEDALSDVIGQRDEYYQMLLDHKIIEKTKEPKDIAIEALEEARLARIESANMAAQLAESHAMLQKLLSTTCSCPPKPSFTPVEVEVVSAPVVEDKEEAQEVIGNKQEKGTYKKSEGGKHGNRV